MPNDRYSGYDDRDDRDDRYGDRDDRYGGRDDRDGRRDYDYDDDYEYERRPRQDIPSYLAQAILCTLFCCVPFGIVGIVFASQVSSKMSIGDYRGARIASDKAKSWCWASFVFGLIGTVLYVILMVAMENKNNNL
jgi:ABC-type Fe3+ transport system permease subunit